MTFAIRRKRIFLSQSSTVFIIHPAPYKEDPLSLGEIISFTQTSLVLVNECEHLRIQMLVASISYNVIRLPSASILIVVGNDTQTALN